MKAKLLIAFTLISAAPALAPSLLHTKPATPAVSSASARAFTNPQNTGAVRTPPANPLWRIPLASLRQTLLKPLFSPSRRPPPPVVSAPPPVQKAAAPIIKNETPRFVLVGTIIGGSEAVALLKDPATQNVISLRAGSEFQGWRLTSIKDRDVTVEKDLFRANLKLPKKEAENFAPATFPVATAARPSFKRRR